jgi:hypothetical protein
MAEPSVYPTGVTRYDPAKAYNSYVLFSAADKVTRLIDLNGNVVHEWKYAGFPSVFLDPKLSAGKRGHVQKLPRPVDQISGQHDAHLIAEGLPGAGNILVFDNQGEGGYPPPPLSVTGGSRVLEIDPVKQEIVWEYDGESSGRPGWTFLSSFISSARRLPNGNTLIDEGYNGRFFEVTPKGEIVWEYVSPYFGNFFGNVPGVGQGIPSNWVYRAQPVPYEWAPAGTAHSEKAAVPSPLAEFRIPAAQ